MPRPALRDDEIEDFRGRLCAAATLRFAEHGAAGVSLRALAADLGCSPTTPYRYFRDKDEILAAVRARAFEALAAACDAVRGREADPERRLAEMGRAYLRFAREEPHAYRVAFELEQPDAGAYPELIAARIAAWSSMQRAVTDAVARGALAGDPITLAHVFWAGVHGLATLELSGQLHERHFEDLEQPLIDTLLRGNRRRGDAPTTPGSGPDEERPT
jgi:AcrR family transcriptional regulator